MKNTPWGRMDMHTNEFYFVPKFSLNFLPYAEDGMFVEEPLEVMFRFNPDTKMWQLMKVYGEDGIVYLETRTLKSLTTQGLVRINAALEHIHGLATKDYAGSA